MSRLVVRDQVCTFCGCCCDDLEITVENNKIIEAKNACALSLTKYMNYDKNLVKTPLIRSDDQLISTDLDTTVEKIATMLVEAKYPLLYGWSSTSCEAIKIGLELTEAVNGVYDNTTTSCHGPSITGIQEIGEASCTLGAVRHRADLIIYWGSNPVHSHPRHLARYSVLSKGRFRQSRKDRKMVVVDVRRTDSAKMADKFIQIQPNQDYELFCALRTVVNGNEIEQDSVAGVAVETIEELAEMMISCEFGVIFWGLGLTMSTGRHRNVEALAALVRDLNNRTKFVMGPMRGWFNVTGSNKVPVWETGYAYAVDFSRGYPRYNPGDTTALDVIWRKECDAMLCIGADPVQNFPREIAENLMGIPIATIDPHITATTMVSDVVVPCAQIGIEAEGTLYRMDGVSIVTKKTVDPPPGVKPDTEILKRILERVYQKIGKK